MGASAKSGSSGFTLLEMIICLFILALMVGMAMVGLKDVLGDDDLREASRQLEIFAKTARSQALDLNRDQELLVLPRSWELRQVQAKPEEGDEKDKEEEENVRVLTYQIPKSVTLKIKRWGSSKWEKPDNLSWVFTSSGLCAPHRFRFERDKSWMEMSFNPLTGNTELEEFYLP